jgi:hypothetical protein
VTDLASRLHAVLELLEADRLPPAAVEVLRQTVESPALRRALRDDAIRQLGDLLGSPARVAEAVNGERWRWDLWSRRSGPPARATDLEVLAYTAATIGPVVSLRQIQRLMRHRTGAQCRAAPAMLRGMANRSTAP